MTSAVPSNRELGELRLVAQGVVDRPFATPDEVARHLVAMQGQQLGSVLAATALRTASGDAVEVVAALDRGELVRGYPMRGTVFLTAADDLPWMTELTRGRQLASAARRRAEWGFTDELVDELAEVVRAALTAAPMTAGGQRALSREELAAAVIERGIELDGGRRYHLFFTLMVQGTIAYGPTRGSQHLLVDAHEALPAGNSIAERFGGDRQAAVTEWLHRYLTGHGPATLRDFQWWTKLPLGEIRAVATTACEQLEAYGVDARGEALWGSPGLWERREALRADLGRATLLPAFDEVVLGYPERTTIIAAEHHGRLVPGNNGVFRPTVHRAGTVIGLWKHGAAGSHELEEFEPLSATARREVDRAYRAYPVNTSNES